MEQQCHKRFYASICKLQLIARTPMKSHLFFVIFLFAIGLSAAGAQLGLTESQKAIRANEWGSEVYDTRISIILNSTNNPIKQDDRVELLVRISNLSTNDEFRIFIQNAFKLTEGLTFVVTSPSGKDVSPIFRKAFRGTGGTLWVHPRTVDGFGVDMAEICKLDEIGTYKMILKLQRWAPGRKTSYEVTSNPLTFTVTK